MSTAADKNAKDTPVGAGGRPRSRSLGYLLGKAAQHPRKALFLGFIELAYRFQRIYRRDWILVDPGVPSRSFSLWKLARLSGIRLVGCEQPLPRRTPLVRFRHRDVTWDAAPDAAEVNGTCLDISKTHVDEVFAQVFGYGTRIDPLTFEGRAVVKSEVNATHSGTFVECPIPPDARREGHIYQRLVRNDVDPETVREYRVIILDWQVFGVLDHLRHVNLRLKGRGGGGGKGSAYRDPTALFAQEDLARIAAFCRELGLEFGELDILPDTEEGRIYIVDANKTPTHMTSPGAMSVRRLSFLWRWSKAFHGYLMARAELGS